VIRLLAVLAAASLALTGVYLIAFGSSWAPVALDVLSGSELGAWLELVIPFLPMACIGVAAFLYVSTQR